MSQVAMEPSVRPALNTAVELIYDQFRAKGAASYMTRVLRQKPAQAVLDALRDPDGLVVPAPRGLATLRWWDEQGGLWDMPVRVEKVLKPVPSVIVRYIGAPHVTPFRREPRFVSHPRGRLIMRWPDRGLAAYRTVARNASRSAVRCFAPVFIEPPQLITVEWSLDDLGLVEGTMRILTVRAPATQYRDKQGHDVIALWEPSLTDDDSVRWMEYLKRSTPS